MRKNREKQAELAIESQINPNKQGVAFEDSNDSPPKSQGRNKKKIETKKPEGKELPKPAVQKSEVGIGETRNERILARKISLDVLSKDITRKFGKILMIAYETKVKKSIH